MQRTAQRLRTQLGRLADDAGIAAPQGLMDKIDAYRDLVQDIGNGNKINLGARLAIAAGTVGAVVVGAAAFGTIAVPAAAGALLWNAESIIFNLWSRGKVSAAEKLEQGMVADMRSFDQSVKNAGRAPQPLAA